MRTRSLKLILSLTLLFVVSFTSGCATSGASRKASRNERAERADALFAAFDANGDGFLSKEELSGGLRLAGLPDLNPNLMMGMKKQKQKEAPKASRKLTEAEIQKTMREAFDRRDRDLDQRLDRDEFRKLVVERPPTEGEDPWAPFL